MFNERVIMSKMQDFILDIDYLINEARLPVSEVAFIMGCTEEMVLDSIQIIRDAFLEPIQ